MLGPKVPIWRSEKYRRYVASKACFNCQIADLSQCAHPNMGKGMALKTDDALSFPLCGPAPMRVGCHTAFDLCLDMTRAERREKEAIYSARMQTIAASEGWQFNRKEAA